MPKTHDLDLSIEEQRKHVKELRFKALSEEAFQFRWNEHGVETYEYSASDWMAKFAEFHAERDLEIKRKQIVAEAEAANRPEPAALLKAKEALKHYADESFWDDPHPDLGYSDGSLYNFEDEILGQIPAYTIAREALAAIGRAKR
jgi:hypothetical protein